MLNLSTWVPNHNWSPNDANSDSIMECLRTLSSNDDDVNILGATLATPDLNMANVENIKNIWQNHHKIDNNYKAVQQSAVYQLINKQWPLPSSSMLYTVSNDIVKPAVKLVDDAKIHDFSALNEYALNWAGFSLQSTYLDNFAIYLAPDIDVVKNIVKKIVNQKTISDKRFDDLNKYYDTIDIDQIVTPLLTNNYSFDDYEAPMSFQNVTRSVLNAEITNKNLVPVFNNYEEVLAPTKILIINVDALGQSSLGTVSGLLKDIKTLNNNLKLNTVRRKQLITKPKDLEPNTNNQPKNYTKKTQLDHQYGGQLGTVHDSPATIMFKTKRIIKWAQTFTNKASSNRTVKRQKSFMRPNRRHPNNFNIAGKLNHIQYKRDIHVFLDTSGSITPDEYATGIQIIAKAAKTLNVDIYFTSFASVTSETVKIPTQNKTEYQIRKLIMDIPKTSGGTDYNNVYNHIMKDATIARRQNRSEPINIMLTDFAYDLSKYDNINSYILDNTYYMGYSANNNSHRHEFARQLAYRTNKPIGFIKSKFA